MIDITQPMFIYDDRSKVLDNITIDRVMFQTGDFILCHSEDEEVDQPLLINTKTERVMNDDFWSWIVSN